MGANADRDKEMDRRCVSAAPREDGEFVFWAAPGGETEPGENEAAAAERELREELVLELRVTGPVFTQANQFFHQGEMQDNIDFFFRAECAREAPRLAGVTPEEIGIMSDIRWWQAGEVRATAERIFPASLAGYLR